MPATLSAIRERIPFDRWLSGRPTRERHAIQVALAVALFALFWAALWQPMVRDAEALRATKAERAIELAAARKMADEAAGLARAQSAATPADIRPAIERALAQQGLRAAVTQLEFQDGRARLVFAAVGYDALIAALEAMQRSERIRVVDAAFTARVEPGVVRAELTLAR